jgi:threonine synthase
VISVFVSHLKCPKCNAEYESEKPTQLCACGSPLLVRYDLESIKKVLTPKKIAGRTSDLWRYREMLPVKDESNIISLGEGMTPLLHLKRIGKSLSMTGLYLKNEGMLPTGTFKDRGAAVGISRAKELGISTLAMPTNGNAGGAWAAYASAAGIRAVIVMPKDAPFINRAEIHMAGADLYLVNCLISDAGKIVGRACADHGWFDVSTLKEPYRIEGKKTMVLELCEQFNWEAPDVILYPAGGGVGIIGIYKAILELREMGWIGAKIPRLVAVQSTGCAPIVKAWEEKKSESEFWENAKTVAFGITVPKAIGDFLVLEAIYKSNGCAVSVSDAEILTAQKQLAQCEGLFVCPEGAATLAAALQLKDRGWIHPNESVVLLNTGTGLKYPETVTVNIPLLQIEDRL